MKLPAGAVGATARLDVVRIAAGPERWGDPMTGDVTARWEGAEAAGALALIGRFPTARQTLCGFAPGWGVRAYGHDPAARPSSKPPSATAATWPGSGARRSRKAWAASPSPRTPPTPSTSCCVSAKPRA